MNSVYESIQLIFSSLLTWIYCLTKCDTIDILVKRKIERKKKFSTRHVRSMYFFLSSKNYKYACWSAGFPSDTCKQQKKGRGFSEKRPSSSKQDGLYVPKRRNTEKVFLDRGQQSCAFYHVSRQLLLNNTRTAMNVQWTLKNLWSASLSLHVIMTIQE